MRALGLTQSGTSQLMQTNGQQQKDSDAYRGNLHTTQYHQSKQLQAIKSTCILMRGLPYSCTESDITKFFQEIDVTPIRIHRKADGAEAYVEFYSVSDTDKAMTRHRNYIGRRYIELFRVSYEDMARTVGLPLDMASLADGLADGSLATATKVVTPHPPSHPAMSHPVPQAMQHPRGPMHGQGQG